MASTTGQQALLIHAAAYVVVNAGLLILNATQTVPAGETRTWWAVWPIAGWGVGLAAHAFAEWAERNAKEGSLLSDPDIRGVAVHLLVYLGVNTILVIVNLTTSPETLWSVWPILGWGIGLAGHAYLVYRAILKKTVQRYATEQEILTQIQLERQAAQIAAAVAPTAEDEAPPAPEPEPEPEPKPARKRAAAKTTRRTTRRKAPAKKAGAKTARKPAARTKKQKPAAKARQARIAAKRAQAGVKDNRQGLTATLLRRHRVAVAGGVFAAGIGPVATLLALTVPLAAELVSLDEPLAGLLDPDLQGHGRGPVGREIHGSVVFARKRHGLAGDGGLDLVAGHIRFRRGCEHRHRQGKRTNREGLQEIGHGGNSAFYSAATCRWELNCGDSNPAATAGPAEIKIQ